MHLKYPTIFIYSWYRFIYDHFYSRVVSELRREYCDRVICRPPNFEVWKSFLGVTHFQNKFWLDVRLSVCLSVRHVFHFSGIFSKTALTISLKFCRCIICANRNKRPPEIFPGKIGKAGKLISNVKIKFHYFFSRKLP